MIMIESQHDSCVQISRTNQGSCERCEARCGMVFLPVCSEDQETIYPNQCQAECAGTGIQLKGNIGADTIYTQDLIFSVKLQFCHGKNFGPIRVLGVTKHLV